MQQQHIPVLKEEVVKLLALRPGAVVVDATIGAGGIAEAIIDRIGEGGRLIGIDRDPAMIAVSRERLRGHPNAALYQSAMSRLEEILEKTGVSGVDAIVFDLGLNSIQLADASRGFSFQREGPLDMRLDPDQEVTAADIVNRSEEMALADLIYRYGGERRSRRIAQAIVRARRKQPIETTQELARIVERAVTGRRGRIHPATRTFQALRIVVNQELAELESALPAAVSSLKEGGRIAVISFHSLEDRIVKEYFSRGELEGYLRRVTRKAVRPDREEVARNPRARSARLRAAEKVAQVGSRK